MQRRLVLTSESTGHAFRRSLPPAALRPLDMPIARNADGDLKLFLLSFAAFFVCFYTFII